MYQDLEAKPEISAHLELLPVVQSFAQWSWCHPCGKLRGVGLWCLYLSTLKHNSNLIIVGQQEGVMNSQIPQLCGMHFSVHIIMYNHVCACCIQPGLLALLAW